MALEGHGRALLKNTTNRAVVPADAYYPSSDGLEMKGLTVVSLQGKCTAATTTIEATMGKGLADDGVAEDWVDISKEFEDLNTGAKGTASWSAMNTILQCNGLNVHKIRVKSTVTNAVNAERYILRRM